MGYKESIGRKFLEEIIETAKEILPEPEVIDENTPAKFEDFEEKKPDNNDAVNEFKTAVLIEKKPEVKKAAAKKTAAKKQREDTKVKINCGIKGDTIEVRDFRAIIKKKGLQINVVLNGIIAEWNHTNYNL
jgi:hypothetical protein